MNGNHISPFEAIGGEKGITALVDTFLFLCKPSSGFISHFFPNDLTETARKQKQFF
ncbi:hypothetical protein GCM10020331_078140 [Ectobacillus funiculus]